MSRVSRPKSSTTAEGRYLKEVDIKSDLPDAAQALARMDAALRTGRQFGAGAVKIIHGYGSTGRGGKIRTAVRAQLQRLEADGRIRGCVFGERFSIFDEPTRRAFTACPALRSDSDLERGNPGITIVLL